MLPYFVVLVGATALMAMSRAASAAVARRSATRAPSLQADDLRRRWTIFDLAVVALLVAFAGSRVGVGTDYELYEFFWQRTRPDDFGSHPRDDGPGCRLRRPAVLPEAGQRGQSMVLLGNRSSHNSSGPFRHQACFKVSGTRCSSLHCPWQLPPASQRCTSRSSSEHPVRCGGLLHRQPQVAGTWPFRPLLPPCMHRRCQWRCSCSWCGTGDPELGLRYSSSAPGLYSPVWSSGCLPLPKLPPPCNPRYESYLSGEGTG